MKVIDKFKRNNHKALSLFVTAGYPTIESTAPLIAALADAGADVIELGIPFSDPIADGPVIQRSSEVALRNGVTLKKTLEIAAQIRAESSVPLVLMGYANPIYAFGISEFMKASSQIGIDGTIIADLPLEESDEYRIIAKQNNIATIFLAAPTTPDKRLGELDRASTGFLYCVSVAGVTGARENLARQAEEFLKRARRCVKNNPLLVGFGISTPEDAQRVSRFSDGVIIGSALINILSRGDGSNAITDSVRFVRSVREALDSVS